MNDPAAILSSAASGFGLKPLYCLATTSEQTIAAGCAEGDILLWDARHMAKTLGRFNQCHDEDVT
jgi:hypothetical protein